MKRRTRRYHSAYRTSAVRRRGTAAGWLLAAVVAGLALYLALAMGLGNWLHDRLAGEAETEGTPESAETIDLTPVPVSYTHLRAHESRSMRSRRP